MCFQIFIFKQKQVHLRVCVCVFYLYVCVCLYIKGQLGLSIFHNSLCNTKDKAQPNMIAFNVEHKSLSCVFVCVREAARGVFCTHSERRFKSLTPLIKAPLQHK